VLPQQKTTTADLRATQALAAGRTFTWQVQPRHLIYERYR
jgi:hypothetical protein